MNKKVTPKWSIEKTIQTAKEALITFLKRTTDGKYVEIEKDALAYLLA